MRPSHLPPPPPPRTPPHPPAPRTAPRCGRPRGHPPLCTRDTAATGHGPLCEGHRHLPCQDTVPPLWHGLPTAIWGGVGTPYPWGWHRGCGVGDTGRGMLGRQHCEQTARGRGVQDPAVLGGVEGVAETPAQPGDTSVAVVPGHVGGRECRSPAWPCPAGQTPHPGGRRVGAAPPQRFAAAGLLHCSPGPRRLPGDPPVPTPAARRAWLCAGPAPSPPRHPRALGLGRDRAGWPGWGSPPHCGHGGAGKLLSSRSR